MAVRVVVVEDSPVQRAHLVDVLEADRDITVVGQAGGPVEAMALVRRLRPDVVTMDLGLPGDGGLGAIERIMADLPTPILVLSARVTGAGSAAAVESLLAGAVEALPKPERWDAEARRQLRCRVRLLRGVTVVAHPRGRRRPPVPDLHRAPPVAVAASTGGPAALAEILPRLGGLAAPVLVVQHLHPQLVDGFVSWMRRVSALPVVVAADATGPTPGSSTSPRPAPTSSSSPSWPPSRRGRPGPSRPAAAAWPSTPTRRACTGPRPTSCSARSRPPRAGRPSACCSPAWVRTARRAAGPAPPGGRDDRPGRANRRRVRHAPGRPAARRGRRGRRPRPHPRRHPGRRVEAGPMSTAGAHRAVRSGVGAPGSWAGEAVRVAERLVAERTGLELGDGLRERLAACLGAAARARGVTPGRFAAGLAGDPGAFQEVLDAVTVQETGFFRHPDQFAALAGEVLPGLQGPVVVWSAGCANGQEAYSLAMELAASGVPDWRVVATDISAAVARARAGRYSSAELDGLPAAHRHWLRPAGALWEVDPALRQRVQFERANLTAQFPAGPGRCQVVFCRNVLIYLSRTAAESFLDRLTDWLAPGGLVFLGYSEAVLAPTPRLRVQRLGATHALKVVRGPVEDRPRGLWTTPSPDPGDGLRSPTGGPGGGSSSSRVPGGPTTPVPASAATVVSFRSGGQDWAVALERVQRVLGARAVLPLPDPRPGVAGLLHRDGHTVTVVSPLGGGQAGQVLVLDDGATSIGLLVDEVVGIERVQEGPGAPPAGQRSPLVAGVLPGVRPLLLLDVGALTGWLAR